MFTQSSYIIRKSITMKGMKLVTMTALNCISQIQGRGKEMVRGVEVKKKLF